ncbi:MAG: transcriptional repressor AgaR [Melioribacteraceae bacterium]
MKNKNLNNNDGTFDRRAKIIDEIETNGIVKVTELSKKFSVSDVTIRNDLIQLEKKNILIRAHGGAMKFQRVGVDFELDIKSKKNLIEKEKIGRKAAGLIKDGDTIILDSGTTTLQIAKFVSNISDLTIITNSLNIAGQLVDFKNVKVIIPGGNLRRKSLSLNGPIAENSIKNFYCDKVFLGVDGIDTNYGISTPNPEEAYLNNIMIDISREVIVVTDSSKFSRKSFAFIAPLSKIHTIITDQNIPPDEKLKLNKSHIKLLIV